MAGLSTKFELWGIGSGATRADQCKLCSAFPAEFHARWVLKLAFPTFHGFPRRNVKKGPCEEVLIREDKQRDGMNHDGPYSRIVLIHSNGRRQVCQTLNLEEVFPIMLAANGQILDLAVHLCNTCLGGVIMPTSNPRINIVCEQHLYYEISNIAKAKRTSLSAVALELIREALELREDKALGSIADKRAKTFDRSSALKFEQVFDE
jgi:hypothetical protein